MVEKKDVVKPEGEAVVVPKKPVDAKPAVKEDAEATALKKKLAEALK